MDRGGQVGVRETYMSAQFDSAQAYGGIAHPSLRLDSYNTAAEGWVKWATPAATVSTPIRQSSFCLQKTSCTLLKTHIPSRLSHAPACTSRTT